MVCLDVVGEFFVRLSKGRHFLFCLDVIRNELLLVIWVFRGSGVRMSRLRKIEVGLFSGIVLIIFFFFEVLFGCEFVFIIDLYFFWF